MIVYIIANGVGGGAIDIDSITIANSEDLANICAEERRKATGSTPPILQFTVID